MGTSVDVAKPVFTMIATLLNTGNVIFETTEIIDLETKIENHLQKNIWLSCSCFVEEL